MKTSYPAAQPHHFPSSCLTSQVMKVLFSTCSKSRDFTCLFILLFVMSKSWGCVLFGASQYYAQLLCLDLLLCLVNLWITDC